MPRSAAVLVAISLAAMAQSPPPGDAANKTLAFDSGPLAEQCEAMFDVARRGVITITLHDHRCGLAPPKNPR